MTHPDVHSMTGAYALDALGDDDRRALQAHLAECDTCREEVTSLRAAAARLGSAVAEPPPASLRDAVLAKIRHTRQDAPDRGEHDHDQVTVVPSKRGPAGRGWLDRLLLPAAAVMAVVLVVMSIVVGNVNRRIDQLETTSGVTEVAAAPDLQTWQTTLPDGGSARVLYSASQGEGWFLAHGLQPAGQARTYELWLIDDQGPAPAGLFNTRDGQAVHAFTGTLEDVAAIGITVEPAGGSPQPTSDPIAVLEL